MLVAFRAACKVTRMALVTLNNNIGNLINYYLMLNIFDIALKKRIVNYIDSVLNSLDLAIMLVISVALLIFTIEILTGQVYRDYKSYQLSRFLIRNVAHQVNGLGLSLNEEVDANKWIKKLRIVKWKKRMFLIIPCIGNSSTVSVIKKRCDGALADWLSGNFSGVNWTPLASKNGGLVTWLIAKEK